MPPLLRNASLANFWGHLTSSHFPYFTPQSLDWYPSMMVAGVPYVCHLSAPHGFSINSHIDSESFFLTYCSVDDAYAIVNSLGAAALMSKVDLKSAFHLIPVCPSDWNLLGMQWRGKFYIDTFLPCGLRSAPFLFNQLSIAIHWILLHKYSIHHLLHYLDDFFTAGTPASQNAQATSLRCSHYAVK